MTNDLTITKAIPGSLLLDCPYCGRGKFTAMGLLHHYCPGLRRDSDAKNPRLTLEQWRDAVAAAQREGAHETQ